MDICICSIDIWGIILSFNEMHQKFFFSPCSATLSILASPLGVTGTACSRNVGRYKTSSWRPQWNEMQGRCQSGDLLGELCHCSKVLACVPQLAGARQCDSRAEQTASRYELLDSLIPTTHVLTGSLLLFVLHPSFLKSWSQKSFNICPVPPYSWQFDSCCCHPALPRTLLWKMDVSWDGSQRLSWFSGFHWVGFWKWQRRTVL